MAHKWVLDCFVSTARGLALTRIARELYALDRKTHRSRWWPAWLWPRVWPFVESDRQLRKRCVECVMGISSVFEVVGACRKGDLMVMRSDGKVQRAKHGT